MAKNTNEAGRARILRTSERLFTEHGYNAVSIRDISEACNLTKAALYYHFPSKDALYGEVIDQYIERLQQQMWDAGQQDGNTVDRLVTILAEYVRLTADRRAYLFQKESIKSGLNQSENQSLRQKYLTAILDPLERIIHQAIEEGEITPLPKDTSPAAILVGMIHGMLVHVDLDLSDRLPIAKIKLVVDIFWRGMSADPQREQLNNTESCLGVTI